MTVRRCPKCKTAHQDDGRPGCACKAGAPVAEPDFTPLHIRPYVHVPESADQQEQTSRSSALGGRTPESGGGAPALRKPADRPGPPDRSAGQDEDSQGSAASVTVRRPKAAPPGGEAGSDRERRRRRVGAVAGAAVAVAAVSAAVFGGLLMAENAFDHPGPDEYQGGPTMMVPTVKAPHPSDSPAQTDSPTPPAASPRELLSAPPSSTPSATPTHQKTADSTKPTASASTGSHQPPPSDGTPPVLKKGDTGPEVVDLQNRLKTVGGLYSDASDGIYDDGLQKAVTTFQQWRSVQGDPAGVYGEHTRQVLESETGGPRDVPPAQGAVAAPSLRAAAPAAAGPPGGRRPAAG